MDGKINIYLNVLKNKINSFRLCPLPLNIGLIHLFSIMLIVTLVFINMDRLNYIAVLNDEFGYWANAVSLAGYNWKDLIVETPYYSIGYSILLVPIIWLLPTPELWYKGAIVLNILLLIGCYFICNQIGRKLFPSVNEKVICLISLIVIIYPNNITYAQVAWSETLQYFLVWLITYGIVQLDEIFSYKYLVSTLVVISYTYCVHTRNIGLMLASLIVITLIIFKHKKKFYNILILIITIIGGYSLVEIIKKYQIDILWNNSAVSSMNNLSISGNTFNYYIQKIFLNLKLFIASLGAKFFYIILGTGMTIIIPLLGFCTEFYQAIKSKKYFNDYRISKLWCLLLAFIMYASTSLQAINWPERKDILLYSRYMDQALGPIFLLALLYLMKENVFSKMGLAISALFVGVSIYPIYLRIVRANGYFNSICSPFIGAFYDNTDNIENAFIWISIYAILMFLVLFSSSFLKKQFKYVFVIIAFLLAYIIIGCKADTYMNGARDRFYAYTVPVKQVIETYPDYNIYFIKNTELDEYSVFPKYLQFTEDKYK